MFSENECLCIAFAERAFSQGADHLHGDGAADGQRPSDHRHHRLRTHPLCRYIHRQGGGRPTINNTIRLKPKDNVYADGEVLAIVTIVTERYRTQYALLYTTRMQEAVTDKEIECSERNAYNNPAVSLSTADMTKYARQIWSSSAKYRNVATKMHRMVMRLNNIYSVGEYFFIDFSVENKTNIRFDIDEMRIKLSDKKQSKATNAQIVELTPSLVLDDAKTFKYGYRNVIVVKKMTFPTTRC